MVVFQQITEKRFIDPAGNDIGQFGRKSLVSDRPLVIMDRCTILVEYGLFAPSVLETMQMNLDTLLVQSHQFVKHIAGAPVINRVGYVERDDMQVFFQNQFLL